MKTVYAIFVGLMLAGTALAAGLPTRVVTNDFIGFVVELTVDSMPDIHRMQIKTPEGVALLDKSEFKDWHGGVTRFEGIIHMGHDVDIITIASGTGVGIYYLHKYRIERGKATLVKSVRIYDWGIRPFDNKLIVGEQKHLMIRQDTNDLWNVRFDIE